MMFNFSYWLCSQLVILFIIIVKQLASVILLFVQRDRRALILSKAKVYKILISPKLVITDKQLITYYDI